MNIVPYLKTLTEEQLNSLPMLIDKERTRRLAADLTGLKPGDWVITLGYGFGGGPGVKCQFIGFVKKGVPTEDGSTYGDDYATFGYGKTVNWLLHPEELGEMIKITKRAA
jgi:hypothetical protein